MVRRSLAFLKVLLATLCLGLVASSASAMTIVPMSDQDLALSVRSIVEGRIVSVDPRWDAKRGAVYTYVTVDVERAFKGSVPPGLVVLKQLGGTVGKHTTMIFGAPELPVNQRVLLFLNTDAEGSLHVAHMTIGDYFVRDDAATGERFVARAGDAAVVAGAAKGDVTDEAPYVGFVSNLLSTLAAYPEVSAAYEAANAGVPVRLAPEGYDPSKLVRGGASPEYTFLAPGFRWFEPDSNQAISIKVNGKAAPTPSKGVDEAKNALGVWSTISGCSFKAVYGGSTNLGGHKADGVSAIAFGDPLHEIDDPVNCSGIIASGGVSTTLNESKTIGGKTFVRIGEGDVVVNNGFDCLLSNPIALSEILTHEFGHAMGLGHSSENAAEPNAKLRDATMFFSAHLDGRGATLREDDTNAAVFLYPGAKTSGNPLSIATDTVPDAVPNALYSFVLRAKGGAAPYTWAVASGALPAGVTLGGDGLLYGTPRSASSETVMVQVRDRSGAVDSQTLALHVTGAPAPFISKVSYRSDAAGNAKLVVTGYNLSARASIAMNGTPLGSAVSTSFRADKGKVTASGTTQQLNIRSGRNTVTVTVDGRVSNAVTF